MNNVIIIFAAILIAFALSTWATIWSRRETRVRLAAVVGFIIVLIGLGPASMEGLGFHRPMWAAWRLDKIEELLVLGYKLVRDEGIYLYVDAGSGEPRAIVLPWDDEEAEKVQQAKRGSEKNGRDDFDMIIRADKGKFVFYSLPQRHQPPPKPAPKKGQVYTR